jgi:hypothetical protein
MSLIMTLTVKGDPKKLEQLAAGNPDKLPAIASVPRSTVGLRIASTVRTTGGSW